MLDELPGAAIDAITEAAGPVADALKPWDSGVRLANFVDVPIDVRACYPPETFDRPQEVKRRYECLGAPTLGRCSTRR